MDSASTGVSSWYMQRSLKAASSEAASFFENQIDIKVIHKQTQTVVLVAKAVRF
jgi:hypothetical protein